MRTAGALLCFALASACSKTTPSGRSGATSGTAQAGSPDGAAGSAPRASSAAARARAPAPSVWQGTYQSAAGTLYIPAQWKHVHWHVHESSAGIGEGTMALTLDGVTSRVIGTLAGPLGPATIDGVVRGDEVTATVRRQNPADLGFTGTLRGTLTTGQLEGSMNLSTAEAGELRQATFRLSPAPASGAAR